MSLKTVADEYGVLHVTVRHSCLLQEESESTMGHDFFFLYIASRHFVI